MDSGVLCFQEFAVDVFREAKEERGRHQVVEELDLPLPSVDVLQSILVEAFKASLETEEGEFSRLSILVMSEEDYDRIRTDSYSLVRFQDPKECTKRNLAKLANLCKPYRNHVLVSPPRGDDSGQRRAAPGESDSDIQIWGLCDIRASTHDIGDSYPIGGDGNPSTHVEDIESFLSINIDPPVPSILFHKPGKIDVRWYGKSIVEWPSIEREHILLHKTGFFERLIKSVSKIIDKSYNSDVIKKVSKPVEYIVHSIVELTVSNIITHGGGGALLFDKSRDYKDEGICNAYDLYEEGGNVVACKDTTCSVGICQSQECRSINIYRQLTNITRECIKRSKAGDTEEKFELTGYARFDIRQLSKSIATLTKHDGAVVMTDHLRLLAFGSKVSSDEDAKEKLHDDTVTFLENHGTRHSTAAKWVASGEIGDRLAIVVSEDAQVTVFHWGEEEDKEDGSSAQPCVQDSGLIYLEV